MAKSFLSVPISQIPTTSTVEDDDYVILESPKKGTRIILKDDLLVSGGINAGKGLIKEDSSTIGVDFANIYGTGLSASEDQLFVDYGTGLSANGDGQLFVDKTQLFLSGAKSSIPYYNADGLSAISLANLAGNVKHLYWATNGNLSAIALTPLTVPTINDSGTVILYNLSDASIPHQIILNATIGGLSAIAAPDTNMAWDGTSTVTISDGTGRWDSSPSYVGFSGTTLSGVSGSLKIQSRILLPAGTYLFDGGFFEIYTATLYCQSKLRLYDGTTGFPVAIVASSPAYYKPWEKSFANLLTNIYPSGTFTITDQQATDHWYLQLDFEFGGSGYSVSNYGYVALGPYVVCGSIKIIKIG